MKRFLILFVLLISFSFSNAQFQCCHEVNVIESNNRNIEHIENGGVFTPKGDLRILVLFVTHGRKYDTIHAEEWPVGAMFPNWMTGNSDRPFYCDYSEFSQDVYSDTTRKPVSNFYYQMSNGLFRLIAEYYPDTITVELSDDDNWGSVNRKALQRMSSNYNWSRFDNRTNYPNYSYDNSESQPDSKIDYIVFCHRLKWEWDTIHPYPDQMKRVPLKGANGFDGTGLWNESVGGGFYISDGFTLMTGWYDPIGIFPHEIGHVLYSGPHYGGGNSVCGKYFYTPSSGWGMMNIMRNYTCALGWERYILDWTPQIKTSNISADIDEASDLIVTNGIYTMRDFITTGDAIRIKLPTIDGSHQYIWLENHQGVSTFDGAMHRGLFCGDSSAEYKKGLIAYIEGYSHVKDETVVNLITHGNAIRWLSRNGDFDYSFIPTELQYGVICGNKTYPMFTDRANPLGGQSVNEHVRHDYDNNGYIRHNDDWNGPGRNANEQAWVVDLNDEEPTARWITGTGLQFHNGDKVGMATNPTVRNMPKYDSNNKKMGDYYLNGISFEVLSENPDGSMTVKIRLDDVAVDRDVRWAAASIVLGDITGDSRPDVDVQPNITLTIDMSGTPNRHLNPDNPNHTPSVVEDFITPTTFSCRNGSYFRQDTSSTVEVINKSSLVLESGSVYEVRDHATLRIGATGTLIVKSGATLRVSGSGHVDIEDNGYLCIEDDAIIDLVDEVSAINISPLPISGVYSGGSAPECRCTTTPLTLFPLTATSNGGIYHCDDDRIITGVNYTGDAYECGETIRVGAIADPNSMSRPQGVAVMNGARVVMDGDSSVKLEHGFKVNLGGHLEVR